MELREYQAQAVRAINDELALHNDALLVLPTGMGKTEVFFACANSWLPSSRVLILLNRVKLLEQTVRRAEKAIPYPKDVFCGTLNSYESDAQLTIATIPSLVRKKEMPFFDYVILDEAHRVESSHAILKRLKEINPAVKILGVTATPWRQTGAIYGSDKNFRKITFRKSLLDGIAMRHLVSPKLKHADLAFDPSNLSIQAGDYAPDELSALVDNPKKVAEQVTDAMNRLEDRKKVIWACVNINHATAVKGLIPEPSVVIHSKMSQKEQHEATSAFEDGDVRHLVFVTIVSEGWDYPPTDAVVFMRPTRSPVLYVQICGRALRPSIDKTDCLILDYGRVVENCGPLDSPREPGGRKKKKQIKVQMKFCPMCFEYVPIKTQICPECSHEWTKENSQTKNLDKKAYDGLGSILSTKEGITIEVEFGYVAVEPYRSRRGNSCAKVTYYPKEILGTPYREYLFLNQIKSKDRLSYLGFDIPEGASFHRIQKRITGKLRVFHSGHYPEIQSVTIYEKEISNGSKTAQDESNLSANRMA